MLAGLIFATEDATDRPDLLAATLPFGGATLIEFQARLLISAGAGQIVVVVERLTPELVGAVNRISRRGVSADIVRSAVEAEQKLHPLARIMVFADGLFSTEAVVSLLSGEGSDALLVTSDGSALPGMERVGHDTIWAGMARVETQRIADVAALPKEYDFQSTLLRVIAQSGAQQLVLPGGSIRVGHGVERNSQRLRERTDAVLAAVVANRIPWIERRVIAPIARRVLPFMLAHAVSGTAVFAGGTLALALGLGLIGLGWPLLGMPLACLAIIGLGTGAALAWMRDDQQQGRSQRILIVIGAALSVLLLGGTVGRNDGVPMAPLAAVMLTGLAALVERGANDTIRKGWWCSPTAFPFLLVPFVAANQALVGLLVGTVYAGVSLSAVIEALREKP